MDYQTLGWKRILTKEQVEDSIIKIAKHVSEKLKGKPFTLVCILKGAAFFFVKLSQELEILGTPHTWYFYQCSSYGNEQSKGKVEGFSVIEKSKFEGREIVLIDELFDSGDTMELCKKKFIEETGTHPQYVHTICLFKKRKETPRPPLDYYGIEVPNVWLVGCGLDDKQEKRATPDLWAVPKVSENLMTEDDEKIFKR